MQLLERKAATRRKQELYSHTIRTHFYFRIIKVNIFHGKKKTKNQALHAEKVLFILRNPITRKTFFRMTFFVPKLPVP